MNMENTIRRIRGAVGNAVVWGTAWAGLGLVAFAALKLTDTLPASVSWLDSLVIAGRLGMVGGIAGGAFSAFIGLVYRGRRLAEISAMRFGAGGGLMAGLFVPAFMTFGRLVSGDGFLPLQPLLVDGLLATVFGGVAAGVSMKLAQRADPLLPRASQLPRGLLDAGSR